MSNEITNRVAKSKLVTIDLEDFYPEGKRILFDIKKWLFQDQILKEKDFRNSVANHNWDTYKNCYIALTCSSDAIIPSWAYLLITTSLPFSTKKVIVGNLDELETCIYQEIINIISYDNYKDKSVIIKGCSEKNIPLSAYTLLVSKLLPLAKSIMYGEACSSVPLYKKML
jgi:hypothetical protein